LLRLQSLYFSHSSILELTPGIARPLLITNCFASLRTLHLVQVISLHQGDAVESSAKILIENSNRCVARTDVVLLLCNWCQVVLPCSDNNYDITLILALWVILKNS